MGLARFAPCFGSRYLTFRAGFPYQRGQRNVAQPTEGMEPPLGRLSRQPIANTSCPNLQSSLQIIPVNFRPSQTDARPILEDRRQSRAIRTEDVRHFVTRRNLNGVSLLGHSISVLPLEDNNLPDVQLKLWDHFSATFENLRSWVLEVLGLPEDAEGIDLGLGLYLFISVYVRPIKDIHSLLEKMKKVAEHRHILVQEERQNLQFNFFQDLDSEDDLDDEDNLEDDDDDLDDRLDEACQLLAQAEIRSLNPKKLKNAPLLEKFENSPPSVEKLKQVLGRLPKGRESFLSRSDSAYRAGIRSILGTMLQSMTRLDASKHSQPDFDFALKTSELYSIITQIIKPEYILSLSHRGDAHIVALARFMRIQDRFLTILSKWSPKQISDTWEPVSILFTPVQQPKAAIVFVADKPSAKEFVSYLCQHPNISPHYSILDTVYFLLNANTFVRSWTWWGPALQSMGCCVAGLGKEEALKTFFSLVKEQLIEAYGNLKIRGGWERQTLEGNSMAHIFLRTAGLHYNLQRQKHHLKDSRVFKKDTQTMSYPQLKGCSHCAGLPPNQQCTQLCFVTKIATEVKVGEGISLAKDRLATSNKNKIIHDARTLQLQRIEPDAAILKRCQRMLFYFTDDKPDAPLRPLPAPNKQSMLRPAYLRVYNEQECIGIDWVYYNALEPSVHRQMIEHEKHAKSSKSGMTATGSRMPMGGASGDTYQLYASFEVETSSGLDRAFDCAEDQMFMMAVCEYAAPSMHKSMLDASAEADRHEDRDEGWSLCSQLRWWGSSDDSDFGFCQPGWGYYLVTRPNMVWSFNSSDLHGTMLPGLGNFEAPNFADPTGAPIDAEEGRGRARARMFFQFHHNEHHEQDEDNDEEQNPDPADNNGHLQGNQVHGNQGGGHPRTSTGSHAASNSRNMKAARTHDRALRTRTHNLNYWNNRLNM
ncbi:hypothetical protein H0H93_011640 [Arthromyces matolae]|nr:hypothetical protein H0H93_011640 [Arthromyces matolae]